MLNTLIRWTSTVQRFLVRIQAASVLDTRSQCPSCLRADKYADRNRRPRFHHRPTVYATRTANGMVVMACVAHRPFIQHQRAYLVTPRVNDEEGDRDA